MGADIATGVNDVAGALASFYPGAQNQVTAATKAMNVVFQTFFRLSQWHMNTPT
jgi:hypothetical protein